MIINKYGLKLRLLVNSDLEMVRMWRNKSRVRKHMQYQKIVSKQDQEVWFSGLDWSRSVYWVFSKNDLDIGLVHIKNIQDEVGEAGVFTGLDEFLDTPVPAIAILVMMDTAFDIIGLKRLRAKISSNNNHTLWANLKFGYVSEDKDSKSEFNYYSTDETLFKNATSPLRQSLLKLYGAECKIESDGNKHVILDAAFLEL
ncbi:MAG: RimJ/RimL family protein N-acetyltransferase [Granulosicoccus sp.]|jgi:RimJ/RimL family protein N-acetyltransferase